MLNLMRKHAGTWLIKLILFAIVIVFVFWGVGSYREQRAGTVASVNGEPISIEEYQNSYNNLLDQLQQRFGNTLTDETLKMLQVKKQALDQIVDKKLMIAEARKLKFRISDEELSAAIKNIKAFQEAGIFSNRLYNRVLSMNRLTPEGFELVQRESMLIEKLRFFITGFIKVSEREAKEWYKWQNASVRIAYVVFKPDEYKNIELSPEDIEKYYDEHKTSYKTEPKIKVQYLNLTADDFKEKINIKDGEISEYYDSNPEEFTIPKTVEARHILLKLEENAPADAVNNAEKKALEVLKLAREGTDFAELAKKYSEGPTKDKGGYLGAFKKDEFVTPFSNKAFSMKEGEISDPVRTQFGWHIIKVEKINNESKTAFNDATSKIRKKLVDLKAKNLAYDEAEEIYDSLLDEENLGKIAKERNINIETTDYFTQNGTLDKKIKQPEKFRSTAFTLQNMEISEVQDFDDGYYILQVIEKSPGKIPELNEIKERIETDLKKIKQEEQAKKDAEAFLTAVKEGHSFEKESEKSGHLLTTTDFFKRNDSIPKIGYESDMTKMAFTLTQEKKIADNTVKGKSGYYIIRLKERKEADLKGFDKERDEIIKRILTQKQQKTLFKWLASLRDKSEVSINEGLFD